jgi:hypothetical protein
MFALFSLNLSVKAVSLCERVWFGEIMEKSFLVHQLLWPVEDAEYLIEIFRRPDGGHFARTAFSCEDVIISDGHALEETLFRHQALLPLAVRSRQMDTPSSFIN